MSEFLHSPILFRVLAGLSCLYFSVGAFGKSGSYVDGIGAAALFIAIYFCGVASVSRSA